MKLLFVGDVMLGRLVNERLRDASPEYPWGDTLPIFAAADARICNLECVIADRGIPAQKTFTFRSDSKNIAVLKAAGIDAVSLANNHSLDYGPDALQEMIGILDEAGIAHAGAGENDAAAGAAGKISVLGTEITLLSFTDCRDPDWEALPGRPGVRYVPVGEPDPRAEALLEHVRTVRGSAELVIISAHWGSNWGREPEDGHQNFAHALIEAGADIVFGHSAHIFRGVELYKGKPIIYSAGDFIDDYAVDEMERNDESFVFTVEFEGARFVRMRMHPTIIEGFQARLPDPDGARRIARRMKELCRKLGTRAEWSETENALDIRL